VEEKMAAAERSEVVDVPLKKLYAVIVDYASYPRFVTGVNAVKVLQKSEASAHVHFDVEMMKKVDYTLNMKEEIDADERSAKVSWSLLNSKFFKISNGLWELKSLGPNKTQVLYKLEIEFDFPVPGFVLKKLVASALPKTIREFSDEALRRP
jgi:ribosome-associated toxin RatA of RatAB toxin-antitoxin module